MLNKTVKLVIVCLISILIASFVYASLSCSVTSSCSVGTTDVFHMSDIDNAHAELNTQTEYTNEVCCVDDNGIVPLGTDCSGATLLRLSDVTNAHAEKSTEFSYPEDVCLSTTYPAATVACGYADDCSSLGTTYTCLASISGDTNAHVGDCNAYTTKVCCALNCGASETDCTNGIDDDCDGLSDCLDPDCFGVVGPNGDNCCNNPAADCVPDDCVIESCGVDNECEYNNRAQCTSDECVIGQYCDSAGGDCKAPDENSIGGEAVCESCLAAEHSFTEGWPFEALTIPNCCNNDANEFYIDEGVGGAACCDNALENCVDSGGVCRTEFITGELTCVGGIDEDCDGLVDNDDPDCSGVCSDSGEQDFFVLGEVGCNQCNHEGDDDGDQSPGNWNLYLGMADLCDVDCPASDVTNTVNFADYEDGIETSCTDGIDNDCDGLTDCEDSVDCPSTCTGNCVNSTCNPATYQWECSANQSLCSGDCAWCDGLGTDFNCIGVEQLCDECYDCSGAVDTFVCGVVTNGPDDIGNECNETDFCCGGTCIYDSPVTFGNNCGADECVGTMGCNGIDYECSTSGTQCAYCDDDAGYTSTCSVIGDCVGGTQVGCNICDECIDAGDTISCNPYANYDLTDPYQCLADGTGCAGTSCICDGASSCVIDDSGVPLIEFVLLTESQPVIGYDSIFVNVSASDVGKGYNEISTFIDFNNSLVLWLRMDDVNSFIVYDNSSYGNDGTVYGIATQTLYGKLGKGFEFSGGYIEGSDDALPTGKNVSTVSLWFKPAATCNNEVMFSYGDSLGGYGKGIICQDWGSIKIFGGTDYFPVNDVTISDGFWHNVVTMYNGTDAIVYYDGSYIVSNPSDWSTVLDKYQIGKDIGGATNDFNGGIDDVMVFNRILSKEEIEAIYADQTSKYVSHNFTELGVGVYGFKAYVQDIAGNANVTEERTVTIIDNTLPTWYDNSTNITSLTKYLDWVTFGIRWSDNRLVDWEIFSWNGSGVLTNDPYYCGSEFCVRNVTKRIDLKRGNNICWKWYANDTSGNLGITDEWCFNVGNIISTHSQPTINSTLGTNYSNEDLFCYNQSTYDVDGDLVKNVYEWYKNGVKQIILENLSTISYSNTSAGDNWSCSIKPFDGYGYGEINYSVNLTIRNRNPTHSKPIINSTYGLNYTDEALRCYNQSTYDADGDLVINIIKWYKDGTEQTKLENLSLISSTNTSIWNNWSCSIKPFDGYGYGEINYSVNLTIRNRIPTHSIPILNSTYGTNLSHENLTCYDQSTYDADGDLVVNIIKWYNNSMEVAELENLSLVTSSNTSTDDVWNCSVTPFDGYGYGETKDSNNLLILCSDLDNDGICDEHEAESCVGENLANIPDDNACGTYYGFNYSSGCWNASYAPSWALVNTTICQGENLCYISPPVNNTCNGRGIIIYGDCSVPLSYFAPENTSCGADKIGYACNSSGGPGSDVIKQINTSECNGNGYCGEDEGVWEIHEDCRSSEECISGSSGPKCECLVDNDNDGICDGDEQAGCVGQSQTNLPPLALCWEINSSGCWDSTDHNGDVINETDCNLLMNDPCKDYENVSNTCQGGQYTPGDCPLADFTSIACQDPDFNWMECANYMNKSNASITNILCYNMGDYGCWDNNIEQNPDNDTSCCGDDGNDELWIDDTNQSGCGYVSDYNKVVYIDDPDEDGNFCTEVGKKIGKRTGGTADCDTEDEEYCWVSKFAAGVSQDPDCCCCGDDPGETWTLFSSGYFLEDVIVNGKCENGKWANRTQATSTLYDMWTYNIP